MKHPYAYAWLISTGLCRWAKPFKESLLKDTLPSPEAKLVRVRLVPEKEYGELKKIYNIIIELKDNIGDIDPTIFWAPWKKSKNQRKDRKCRTK